MAAAATEKELDEGMADVEGKEGAFLLGLPTFVDLGGGKFRCSETGHDLPESELELHGRSKSCRLALIDAAIANKKAPLNFFKLDASSKSKLICKLTGDTINKSEEHIWKHINGRKFLRKLEQKEEDTGREAAKKEKQQQKPLKKKSTKKGPENSMAEDQPKDDDEENDFWMPPIGERWDMDDGNDRWNSGESSDNASDTSLDSASNDADKKAEEDNLNTSDLKDLNKRTKRMAIEIGPSSYGSRKKKKKVDNALKLPQNS